MLEIFYCEEVIFDLPPPTLFYRADEDGFRRLITVIDKMIIEQREVCLNDYDFVKISDTTKRIIFRSSSKKILLRITENEIITDISTNDWNEIVDIIKDMITSTSSLTYFVEYDDYYEEGNIVIES